MAKVRKVRRGGVSFSSRERREAEPSAEKADPSPVAPPISDDPSNELVEFDSSPDLDQLASAFVQFREEAENPGKDREGYNYSYTSLANVIETTQPLLAKYGLAVSQFPIASARGLGVLTILMHSSGQYIRSRFVMPIPALSGTNATQDAGAAITYARRYALSAVLCIASDEDTDADYERLPARKPARRKK